MSNVSFPLFVYGSSRKGHVRSCENRAKYIGLGSAQGYVLYELFALGRSYALHSPDEVHAPLSGELYDVDKTCLEEMDIQHEVLHGLYERVLASITTANGLAIQAWIYEGLKIAPVKVESGDWDCRGIDCGKA